MNLENRTGKANKKSPIPLPDSKSQLDEICQALQAEQQEKDSIKVKLEGEITFKRNLMEYMPVGLMIIATDTQTVEYVNPKSKEIFGWRLDAPADVEEFLSLLFADPVFRSAAREKYFSPAGDVADITCLKNLPVRVSSDEEKVVSITSIPIPSQSKLVAAIMDDTERKRTEDLLTHLAAYDPLTDLPNRTLFFDRLNHALEHARRDSTLAAVMILDLDNFKTINDAYGHDYGDKLLNQAGKRLRGILRESDTVAHLGGDEFGILIEDFQCSGDLDPILRKIQSVFIEPFFINASHAYITTSIGVSVYPEHGSTMQVLIKNADTAVHAAKEFGKNTYRFYCQVMGDKALDTLVMATELRHALSQKEFELHYQPQYDISSGKIIGLEALLRWNRPAHGLVCPSRFIPLAEDTGVIVPIGEWVLRTACQQSIDWQQAGLPPLRVSVNLSEKQLKHPRFLETVQEVLAETTLSPDLLVLEFTENIIFRDSDIIFRIMEDLHALGVHLALDDFGTGYTSLSYLARFPFDTIKIDMSFAKKITTYPGDAAIVAGVIAIARSLDMATIVEGVETTEQANFFVKKGCSQIQGWYFSPALPVKDMEMILRGKNNYFSV